MTKSEVIKEVLESFDEYAKYMLSESHKRIQYDDTDYYKGKVSAFYQVRDFIRREFKKCMEEE